jgi:phage baseplate assembly protein W
VAIYKGFSSYAYGTRYKSLSLSDADLVKADIMNAIMTVKGSRIKMRNYGTHIKNILMSPFDDITIKTIESEIIKVFKGDPRVALSQVIITPNFSIKVLVIQITFKYIELQQIADSMVINLAFVSQ